MEEMVSALEEKKTAVMVRMRVGCGGREIGGGLFLVGSGCGVREAL